MKTFKLPTSVHCSYPLLSKQYAPVNELYSLFQKTGKNSYKRMATTAFPFKSAYTVFKDWVSKDATLYFIRLVKITPNEAQGVSRFKYPSTGKNRIVTLNKYGLHCNG